MTTFERAGKRLRGMACRSAAIAGIGLLVLSPATHAQTGHAIAATGAADRVARHDADMRRLRLIVVSQQRGRPDYGDMEAPLAALAARQAPALTIMLTHLGQLQSIEFLREVKGECVYELWFANGRMLWGVALAPSGKIGTLRALLKEHR